LACEECGRNFKVLPQELKRLRDFEVPVSHKCFNCRHFTRRRAKNPRKLWKRESAKSGTPLFTSYAPDRPEKVWTVDEYIKEFF